ncbi:ABC transporter permease [Acuticoccus sediminis]|uniref:ABC transporter permease n=1 Tax=Acuticoccus sediminis TaxID=2184697 RepID=UPI001CFEF730|nr:ABC transporter permease [Acuticoccus sediminis]
MTLAADTAPAPRRRKARAKLYPVHRVRDRLAMMLGVPALLVLGVFFLVPIGGLIATSFQGPTTFASYERFMASRAAITILTNTVLVAAAVTAICAVIAVPFALAVRALPPLAGRIVLLAAVLPLWISSLVRTYAWLYMLSREGVLNAGLVGSGIVAEPLALLFNWGAVTVGMVHVLLPYMILPVHNAVRAIPTELIRAAQSLGAGPARVFATVVIPLIGRGVATGALIVFVIALGFYITPLMLGGRTNVMLAVYVDTIVNVTLNWPNAAAAAVILVLLVTALLAAGALIARLRPVAKL